MSIKVDISVGELLDKITILEIKAERITDPGKLNNVNKELSVLIQQWETSEYSSCDLTSEIAELKKINEQLWEIEDAIRDEEKNKTFDERFIDLARSVYVVNDNRAKMKHIINEKAGSELTEEKSYSEYN
ncbi:MAG: hypothetical protein GKR93_16210 [Gammaproteobacteria bacterium]|nr:hypothetical protein [Gammaproteobacteria bacterium]